MADAPAGAPGRPTVALIGDSVVATGALGVSRCDDYSAAASRTGGSLVLLLVPRQEPDRVCVDVLEEGTFRLAAAPVPAGRYLAQFRVRSVSGAGSPIVRTVAWGTVRVPLPTSERQRQL